MIHDSYLPDMARSLNERRTMLAESLSDLSDSPPLIALTVGTQLVTDLGYHRAARVAEHIAEAVTREGQAQQYRTAFEAAPVQPQQAETKRAGLGVIVWLIICAGAVLGTLGYLLFSSAASAAIEQRDLYRALGDAAPAFQVMQ